MSETSWTNGCWAVDSNLAESEAAWRSTSESTSSTFETAMTVSDITNLRTTFSELASISELHLQGDFNSHIQNIQSCSQLSLRLAELAKDTQPTSGYHKRIHWIIKQLAKNAKDVLSSLHFGIQADRQETFNRVDDIIKRINSLESSRKADRPIEYHVFANGSSNTVKGIQNINNSSGGGQQNNFGGKSTRFYSYAAGSNYIQGEEVSSQSRDEKSAASRRSGVEH